MDSSELKKSAKLFQTVLDNSRNMDSLPINNKQQVLFEEAQKMFGEDIEILYGDTDSITINLKSK